MKPIIYGIMFGFIGWLAIELQGIEAAIIGSLVIQGLAWGGIEAKLKHYGNILDRHTDKLFPSKFDD